MRWWEYQGLIKPVLIAPPLLFHSRHGVLKLALKQAHRWTSWCGSWCGASCSGGPVQALRWESSALNGPLWPTGISLSPGAKVALCVRSTRCAVWHICPLGFTVPLATRHTQNHTHTISTALSHRSNTKVCKTSWQLPVPLSTKASKA